ARGLPVLRPDPSAHLAPGLQPRRADHARLQRQLAVADGSICEPLSAGRGWLGPAGGLVLGLPRRAPADGAPVLRAGPEVGRGQLGSVPARPLALPRQSAALPA